MNKAVCKGNVPLFVKDSIEIVEKIERAREHEALAALQSKGGIEISKFDPPSPMERTEDKEQTQRSVGSFVERRTELSRMHRYRPYASKPNSTAPNSLRRPEAFGQLQRPFEQFVEQKRSMTLVKTSNEDTQRSKEPSPLERLEALREKERSEPLLPKQAPEAHWQTRASVIFIMSMGMTNPLFVPLIPKLEKT